MGKHDAWCIFALGWAIGLGVGMYIGFKKGQQVATPTVSASQHQEFDVGR